ncbi:gliding motility-associated C-terminal domain-containing protein [Robiginitalea aurantiaca]|uniref:Gliding motility-associated C-terminal domain-containing protein n=1 Tax=Robiginitalea aurantiaca TaxID=3056915 RepID=A0ABT7WIJ6_9FLAO|nr:gliding motility-associated C-terminal domain-containing protein [Robiginitalea aurantiaca]MDM9632737.1 gliding motility-associated C-terminal domain-containing protein [Robiginitalea aurantiaca]
MRILLLIFTFSIGVSGFSQPTLQHYGGMQFHEGAQVGLYGSFVNQAPFEQDAGLLGFYGFGELRISGDFAPLLYDTEIFRGPSVILDQSMSVANNLNFIQGDLETDKALPELSVTLLQDAFTVGEANRSKVNGYVTVINQSSMVFPVGDAAEYRPLTLEGAVFPIAKCAYFRENPNAPSAFPPFRTDLKPLSIAAISTTEFWRLEGSSTGQVTLSWNPNSNLGNIATSVGEVTLMGWRKATQRWESLGTQSVVGDLLSGFAISEPLTPDAYEILTFGSLAQPVEIPTLDNYFMSPNGDGINDVLIIEELVDSRNNKLQIFDRNGLKVFELNNYQDEFDGTANVNSLIINQNAGLSEGVYFFLATLFDLGLEFQGFLYLDR